MTSPHVELERLVANFEAVVKTNEERAALWAGPRADLDQAFPEVYETVIEPAFLLFERQMTALQHQVIVDLPRPFRANVQHSSDPEASITVIPRRAASGALSLPKLILRLVGDRRMRLIRVLSSTTGNGDEIGRGHIAEQITRQDVDSWIATALRRWLAAQAT